MFNNDRDLDKDSTRDIIRDIECHNCESSTEFNLFTLISSGYRDIAGSRCVKCGHEVLFQVFYMRAGDIDTVQ